MTAAQLIALNHSEATLFFTTLLLLLVSAHIFGYIVHRLGFPRAIGEIMGGLALGPTVLGQVAPEFFTRLFLSSSLNGKLLGGFYIVGLVLLMFISGFEIHRSITKSELKFFGYAIPLGVAVPFLAGWFIPDLLPESALAGPKATEVALRTVLGIAVSITSIPVISRIFIDLNIIRSPFAKLVLTTATIEDIFLWSGLAVVTATAGSSAGSLAQASIGVATTLAFFVVTLALGPWLVGRQSELIRRIFSSPTAYLLSTCLLFTSLANLLQINLIFGALLAGTLFGLRNDEKIDSVRDSIKEFCLALFIPLYFAIVGLKLDLVHQLDVRFFAFFLLFATVVKIVGMVCASRLAGHAKEFSIALGVAMNARGGPGIVLASMALDAGIASEGLFTSLTLLAVVTSILSGFWLRRCVDRSPAIFT